MLLEHVGSLMSPNLLTIQHSHDYHFKILYCQAKNMRLLLSLVSLLSLATANPVSRNPSCHEAEYTWECGKTAPYNSLDCSKLLHWIKDTSKTGWFGIGKANNLTQYWGSCQIYTMAGPLGHFALEIQQDEFVDVINRGMTRECQDEWARVMVRPHNNTWVAFLTEKGWEPSHGF